MKNRHTRGWRYYYKINSLSCFIKGTIKEKLIHFPYKYMVVSTYTVSTMTVWRHCLSAKISTVFLTCVSLQMSTLLERQEYLTIIVKKALTLQSG